MFELSNTVDDISSETCHVNTIGVSNTLCGFVKAINITFYCCAFYGRYYDQLEAMEGKLPISESQVRFTESQSWLKLDSVVVKNSTTAKSCYQS